MVGRRGFLFEDGDAQNPYGARGNQGNSWCLTFGTFAASIGVFQIGDMIGIGYIWKIWIMCSVVQSMSCCNGICRTLQLLQW